MKVNNVDRNPCKYIVARKSQKDSELWFWGSWDSFSEATKAAMEIGGIVIPLSEVERPK